MPFCTQPHTLSSVIPDFPTHRVQCSVLEVSALLLQTDLARPGCSTQLSVVSRSDRLQRQQLEHQSPALRNILTNFTSFWYCSYKATFPTFLLFSLTLNNNHLIPKPYCSQRQRSFNYFIWGLSISNSKRDNTVSLQKLRE